MGNLLPSSSIGFHLAAEAAANLFEGSQLAARDRLMAWWTDRQDVAFLKAFRLTQGKLHGTRVTSVTATALKIRNTVFNNWISTIVLLPNRAGRLQRGAVALGH